MVISNLITINVHGGVVQFEQTIMKINQIIIFYKFVIYVYVDFFIFDSRNICFSLQFQAKQHGSTAAHRGYLVEAFNSETKMTPRCVKP